MPRPLLLAHPEQIKHSVTPGAAGEFLWGGDMAVQQDSPIRGAVAGTYEDTRFSFFNVNLNWRF